MSYQKTDGSSAARWSQPPSFFTECLLSDLVLFRRSLNIRAMAARRYSLCSDQDWSRRGEDTSVSLSWGSLVYNEFWESQSSSCALLGLLSQNIFIELDASLDDVNWVTSGTVSTGHFGVHLSDSSAESVTSVLLVHVYNISSGSILENDSVVLDGVAVSLENLTDWDDFTLALSDLVLSLHFVPELRSSKDGILGENSDSVAGWFSLSFTW